MPTISNIQEKSNTVDDSNSTTVVRVRLINMKKESLNGAIGTRRTWNEKKQRFKINLLSKNIKKKGYVNVKPINLEVISEETYKSLQSTKVESETKNNANSKDIKTKESSNETASTETLKETTTTIMKMETELNILRQKITNSKALSDEWMDAQNQATELHKQITKHKDNETKFLFVEHEDSLMQIPFFSICRLHNLQSAKGKLLNNKFAIVIGLSDGDSSRAKVQLLKGAYKSIKWKNLKPVTDVQIITMETAATLDPRTMPSCEFSNTAGTESIKEFFNARRHEIQTNNKSNRNLCHFACEHHQLQALKWLHMLITVTDVVENPQCLHKECKWDDSNFHMFWLPDRHGCTPLFLATLHSKRVKRPDLDPRLPNKDSVVWEETNSGTDIIKYLLEFGGPYVVDSINTPINTKFCFEGIVSNNAFTTPMSNACHHNNFSMVEALHKAGAHCYSNSAKNSKNEPEQPLFNAVKFASSLKIVQYLVRNGCKEGDIRYIDSMGGTPTLFAARWNNFELLKYLTISTDCRKFDAIQDTRRPTVTGRTVIGVAFQNQSFEVSQFLILVCNCMPSDDPLRCMFKPSFLQSKGKKSMKEDLVDWGFNLLTDFAGKDEESKIDLHQYIFSTYMASKEFQTVHDHLKDCIVEKRQNVLTLNVKVVISKLIQFCEQLEPKFKERLNASLSHGYNMFKKN